MPDYDGHSGSGRHKTCPYCGYARDAKITYVSIFAMKAPDFPFIAMILAGGLGTRLRSVLSDRPKPMALVRGVPFLDILIDSLAGKGVRKFAILTGYLGRMIEEHLRDKYGTGLDIAFSQEDEPLGTGGAVKLAAHLATEPTLLVNGDTFFDADLGQLSRFHEERRGQATLSLVKVQDSGRYGSVEVDQEGRVAGFREKDASSGGPGLVNAGVSMLTRQFILDLPAIGHFSMEKDIFPNIGAKGELFGLCQDRAFFDIGTPESYEAFKSFMASGELRKD
ncbi:MAG: nucleotidyltransferase family protein [Thermodesulfobacteriota bacterium]